MIKYPSRYNHPCTQKDVACTVLNKGVEKKGLCGRWAIWVKNTKATLIIDCGKNL